MRSAILGALLAFCVIYWGHSAQASMSPNIVLIIADDMNWDDCGAYGHPSIRTPNIDRLSQEGMLFRRAYVTASSCSPSRASMVTGRYPHNTGAEQLHWPLPPDSVTFVQQLQGAGYFTVAAGKWHLGNAIKNHFHKVYEVSTAGFQLPSGDGKSPPKMIASQPSGCEDWLRALRERPRDRPFFGWLAALDPHREYEPGSLDPPHAVQDVVVPAHLPDTPEVREDLRLYYDEIGRLDQFVGKVLRELERQGVSDNTAVFFVSDNGRPFPRDKTTLYEGGIRTPFLVKWPGMVQPGSTSDSLISMVDLAPTFGDIAGLPRQPTYEGKSILPILRNPTVQVREYVFAEDHWHDFEDHARSVSDQRYKLIRNDYPDLPATPSADALRSPTWQIMRRLKSAAQLSSAQLTCFQSPRPTYELYDLPSDPGELRNLAADPRYQSTLRKLRAELEKWAEATGDYLPSVRTPDEFDRETGEPDHAVRIRPRRSKKEMFGTYGKY